MAARVRTLQEAGITQETLELTPARTLQFLTAVGMKPAIRATLAKFGYDKPEHLRGWKLLEKVSGRFTDDGATDADVADAIATLDNWDEPGLRMVRAALSGHPAALTKVLDGLAPIEGPGAVLNVQKLLKRLDELEGTDPEAVAKLAKRGIDAAERKRLAGLVKVAQGSREPTTTPGDQTSEEERQQDLLELREWLEEWLEFARLHVKRRDYRIRLGIAERRSPTTPGADPAPDDDTDPTGPGGPFLPEPKPGQ